MHRVNEKKGRFLNKEQSIILVFGLLLFFYYVKNIGNIYSIWELGDEAGYIFNASLVSKDDWRDVFSNVTAYYGYGYSMILIPLFYICDSGLSLIRGIIGVNIACILLLYFIQVVVMSRVLPKCSKSMLSLFSMIVCLLPYLTASSMKTICEVYLTLLVWVIGFVLYKTIDKKSYGYFVVLNILTAYISFVHTRSMVVVIAVWLILLLQMFYAKERKKAIVLYCLGLAIFAVTYIILKIGKDYILNILGSGIIVKPNTATINVINTNVILDRLKWLFTPENIAVYFHSAIGKVFYLIVTTRGTILFAFYYLFAVVKEKKALVLKENYIELFFYVVFLFMLGLCMVSGTGNTYVQFIYGRYYEYTICFLIFIGMYYLLEQSPKGIREYLITIAVILITGVITSRLDIFSEQNSVVIDTSRYAGFSYGISKTGNWDTLIFNMTLLSVAIILIFALVKNIKYRKALILLIIVFGFLRNNEVNLAQITNIQQNLKSDVEMVELIEEEFPDIPVYFIYEPYRYSIYFTRIQVHLKNKKMSVILPEDVDELPEQAYVITYIDSKASKNFKGKKEYELLTYTHHYKLYLKNK